MLSENHLIISDTVNPTGLQSRMEPETWDRNKWAREVNRKDNQLVIFDMKNISRGWVVWR